MANKTFNTRISLKYDSYANWIANDPVLLKGEAAVAVIPAATGALKQEPATIIKIGDGEAKFSALPVVSGIAADIYSWAKEAAITVSKSGDGNVVASIEWDQTLNGGKGGIKYTTASVATSEGLAELQAAVKAIEDDYLTGTDKTELEGKIGEKLATADFNTFKTENTAAIATAKQEAIDASDAVQAGLDAEITRAKEAEGKVLTDAKAYTDEKDAAMDLRVDALEAKFGEGEGSVADQIADAVAVVDGKVDTLSATHAADKKALEDSIGVAQKAAEDAAGAAATAQGEIDALEVKVGTVAEDKTVVQMISDAQSAVQANIDAEAARADAAEKKALEDAKAYADAEDKKIEDLIGTVTEGKTVVEMIADAKTAATYDDTQVKADIKANADAIATLNGAADAEGSVDYKIAQAVAAIMENPDETMNSINELVTWCNDHAADALELSNKVSANEGDIAALEELVGGTAVATQITNAIAEALKIEGADKYALAADLTAAIGRIAALESATHTHDNKAELDKIVDGDVDKWNAAQANAEATAISAVEAAKSQLEAKIADAEQSAKSDAATLNTNMDARVSALEAIDHSAFEAADQILSDNLMTEIGKKVDAVEGKGLSTNDYTNDEKTKLEGIAAGAQVNVIETVKVNGVALAVADKAVDVTVPTGELASKDKVSKDELADALKTEIEGKLDASAVTGDLLTHNASEFATAGHNHDDVYSKLDHNHKIEDLQQEFYVIFNCGSSSEVI